MDRLIERVVLAERALTTLDELAQLTRPTPVERDAAIQRFEYTFETVWKCAQRYLQEVEKVSAGSPRAIVRSSREVGLLTDAQAVAALEMCDDRNLTVHTYDEALAQRIFGRLAGHAALFRVWLSGIQERLRR